MCLELKHPEVNTAICDWLTSRSQGCMYILVTYSLGVEQLCAGYEGYEDTGWAFGEPGVLGGEWQGQRT